VPPAFVNFERSTPDLDSRVVRFSISNVGIFCLFTKLNSATPPDLSTFGSLPAETEGYNDQAFATSGIPWMLSRCFTGIRAVFCPDGRLFHIG
jgi:hypothetical protein